MWCWSQWNTTSCFATSACQMNNILLYQISRLINKTMTRGNLHNYLNYTGIMEHIILIGLDHSEVKLIMKSKKPKELWVYKCMKAWPKIFEVLKQRSVVVSVRQSPISTRWSSWWNGKCSLVSSKRFFWSYCSASYMPIVLPFTLCL